MKHMSKWIDLWENHLWRLLQARWSSKICIEETQIAKEYVLEIQSCEANTA